MSIHPRNFMSIHRRILFPLLGLFFFPDRQKIDAKKMMRIRE